MFYHKRTQLPIPRHSTVQHSTRCPIIRLLVWKRGARRNVNRSLHFPRTRTRERDILQSHDHSIYENGYRGSCHVWRQSRFFDSRVDIESRDPPKRAIKTRNLNKFLFRPRLCVMKDTRSLTSNIRLRNIADEKLVSFFRKFKLFSFSSLFFFQDRCTYLRVSQVRENMR